MSTKTISITKGDDFSFTVQLKKNGSVFVIAPTAVVTSRFYYNLLSISDEITLDDLDTNAIWATSLVDVSWNDTESDTITKTDIDANLLIKIVEVGNTTSFHLLGSPFIHGKY